MSTASPPPSASTPPPSQGPRWLHLWAPRLPTDRLRRARPDLAADLPLAVTAKVRNALRLVAVDAAACAEGLAPGLTSKEARRIAPHLVTVPEDPAADAVLAARLTALCRLTAPSVSRDGSCGFVLDVTGAARLHGGEPALAAQAVGRFAAEGVEVCWALADTPGLAWAAAQFGGGGIVHPGAGAAVLSSLPVEALRLPPEDAADLRALGFKRVGQVLERPRALLAETLEGRLGARLDELLAAAAVALAPERARLRYYVARTPPQAVTGAPAVLAWTRRLAEALEPQLLAHGLGARGLELTLVRADGAVRTLRVRTRSPRTDPAALTRLFEGPLETLGETADGEAPGVGAEIESLRLEARLTAPIRPLNGDLLRPGEVGGRRFEAFVESLSARLGEGVVEAPRRDPHTLKPEREVRLAPLASSSSSSSRPPPPAWDDAVLRPVRLFEPPQAVEVIAGLPDDPPATLLWRRQRRRVVRAEGPERLAPEWGRETEGTLARDYYRMEDEEGRRYWVFREGLATDPVRRWWLQGLFA